jgi:peptidoglycan-associated lipoprotein
MIASRRGRRGSTEVTPVPELKRSRPTSRPVLLVLCLLVALACACGKKRPTPEEGVGGGIADQGLADSSLDRARGGLGPAEGDILKDVHFAYDSDDLDESARATLDDNLSWLRDNPKPRIEIEGHCDNRGTIEYNLALGARRAKAVQDYLAAQGIAGDRLKTISYGKELPLCHEDTEECWARNRRAHFVAGQ